MSDTASRPLFKDYFDATLAQRLAADIGRVYPTFAHAAFVQQVATGVPPLELKERVALIGRALHAHLPPDYPHALSILAATLGAPLVGERGMFTHGYHLMPVAWYVETYGLAHPEQSLAMLREITRRFSSEFAIRPYLLHHRDMTLTHLHAWADDPDVHVRRLVSEGTRTRLPWATRLQPFIDDPQPVLTLLTKLRHDPSPYVRKSVANNLNDLSKDHPDVVLTTLAAWQRDSSPQTQWITRHALRTLVKHQHPTALHLVGAEPPQLTVHSLTLAPPVVAFGTAFTLSLDITSTAATAQALQLDYQVHLLRGNGQHHARTFRLARLTLAAGERRTLSKQHAMRPVTVRRYYAGSHRVTVLANGSALGEATFTLVGV